MTARDLARVGQTMLLVHVAIVTALALGISTLRWLEQPAAPADRLERSLRGCRVEVSR